jgi:Fic family protein
MDMFRDSFMAKRKALHPVVLVAYAHLELVQIHPFHDGNGRTSRLLMNLVLVNKGFQIISFDKDDRFRYYQALETSYFGDPVNNEFADFIAEMELNAQKFHIKLLNIEYPGPCIPEQGDGNRGPKP